MPAALENSRSLGLFNSIKALGATAIAILHTRLELLSVEILEEGARLGELILVGALTWLSFCLASLLVILFIIVGFWDTPYRLLVVGMLGLFFILATIALGLAFLRKSKTHSQLFSASLQALAADHKELNSP